MWPKNNGNGYPCGRWTCPKTARYGLRSTFTGIDARGVDNFVYAVINGKAVFSSRVQGYQAAVTFATNNVPLSQGAYIDFTLVWAGGVDSEYGWTDVDAVISEETPLSEPDFIVIGTGKYKWSESKVNSGGFDVNQRANLARLSTGDFIVAWNEGTPSDCFGRVYDTQG